MKSCLVIKNDGMGDLIVASGVISRLSEKFNGNLDLITCSDNRAVAELIPGIRRVLYISRDSIASPVHYFRHVHRIPLIRKQQIPWSNVRGDFKVFLHLLTHQYDTAICLRRFIRRTSATLMCLTRAKEKYCCWNISTNISYEDLDILTHKWIRNVPFDYPLWEAEYYAAFLKNVFDWDIETTPKLNFPAYEMEEPIEKHTIGLIITDRGKRSWPDTNWLTLIQKLVSDKYKIALFGNGEGRRALRARFSENPQITDYCGKIPFVEHVRYFVNLPLIVAEDTGLAHLASLCGCRVAVLQAAGSNDGFFFPWTDEVSKNHVIVHSMPCAGFGLADHWQLPCLMDSRIDCISRIKPDAVYNTISDLLGGFPKPKRIDISGNAEHSAHHLSHRCCPQNYLA